jgi:hypothetical protein
LEYSLYIDQLSLKRWHDKIDLVDAAIIGFIRNLNADSPDVSRRMRNGYYQLNRDWLIEQIPLLHLSPDRLGKRLHQLEKVGLLDLQYTPLKQGRRKLFGKLSKLYSAEEERAKRFAEKHSASPQSLATMDENDHGRLAQTSTVQTTTDHYKNDHEDETPPPLTAAGGASQEEEQPAPLADDPLLATCKVCGSVYQKARPGGCNYCEEHPRSQASKPDDFDDDVLPEVAS